MRPTPKPPLPRVRIALALRRRPRLRLALATAAAVVLGLAVARVASDAEATRAAWGGTRTVLVATRDLPAGHRIGLGDTEPRRLPRALVPPGALATAPTGQVVREPVLEGEVLPRRRLGRAGSAGLVALLPAGTRAVAVPRDPATVPPVRVGQRVDVVAVVGGGSAGGPPALVLARAAPVVSVDEDAIAVAVAPATVPRVAAALAEGAVTLAVVAPED
jgi:Flp pilus assembly protein CpaB